MFKAIRRIFNRSINNKDISYKTAMKTLQQENGVLVDVRSKQEYEEGHLPTAINISVYDLNEKIQKQIMNKQMTIVLYCTSGTRSKQAQIILEKLGYENVYNLKGGLDSIV